MAECEHLWARSSNNWTRFYCKKCGILGYFQKTANNHFKITPYICQNGKCRDFVTKINEVGERYCKEHYVEKRVREAWCGSNIHHNSIDPEIYYERFTGK